MKSQGRRQRTGDTSNCGQLVDGWGGKRAWRNTLAEINIYYLRLGAESQIQEILHSMGCGARNVCLMKRTRVDQDWKYIYNLMRVEVESQNKQQKYRRWWAKEAQSSIKTHKNVNDGYHHIESKWHQNLKQHHKQWWTIIRVGCAIGTKNLQIKSGTTLSYNRGITNKGKHTTTLWKHLNSGGNTADLRPNLAHYVLVTFVFLRVWRTLQKFSDLCNVLTVKLAAYHLVPAGFIGNKHQRWC